MPDAQEPPIREFADRGTQWLLESPENLRGLLALIAEQIAARLDFSRAERINRSFIPADLNKQEADVLYLVPFQEDAREVWVYTLLEQQSRPDRMMGLRLLLYMGQIWDAQRRAWEDAKTPEAKRKLHPIVPVVFYTGKRRWTHSLGLDALMDTPTSLLTFTPRHETLFLKLYEIPPEKLTGSAIALALRALQASEEPKAILAAVLAEVVTQLEALPEEAQAEWRRAMQFLLLLIHHKRAPEDQEYLSEVVVESVEERHRQGVEEMRMTSAQALMDEGRKNGRLEERRALLLLTIETRLGRPSQEIEARVNRLAEDELTPLIKRALTAGSLEELGL